MHWQGLLQQLSGESLVGFVKINVHIRVIDQVSYKTVQGNGLSKLALCVSTEKVKKPMKDQKRERSKSLSNIGNESVRWGQEADQE